MYLQFNFTMAKTFRPAGMIIQIKVFGVTNLSWFEETLVIPF